MKKTTRARKLTLNREVVRDHLEAVRGGLIRTDNDTLCSFACPSEVCPSRYCQTISCKGCFPI